jgi:hypothetical protein
VVSARIADSLLLGDADLAKHPGVFKCLIMEPVIAAGSSPVARGIQLHFQ